jgi:thiamine kinase-like enzyme
MTTRTDQTEAKARISALGIWQGDITLAPLKGGISNESWVVSDARGPHVVRFGKDYPFHHVLRAHEVMVSRAAAEAGFAPALIHAEAGVMVTQYLGARTYGAEDVRANLPRITEILRDFHQTLPHHVSGPGQFFWPFHVIRDYARTLARDGSRMTPHLPRFLGLATALEAVQTPLPIVFAHNDLLPANILDDGTRLWLIDFEYAGFSTPLFDLAGLTSNAGCDAEETEGVLAGYFGTPPDTALRRAMAAMQCASLLREAMWSMVSELHLNAPGTDYPAYTDQNLAALETALDAYQQTYGKL